MIERFLIRRGHSRGAANALDQAGIRMAVADYVLLVLASGLIALAVGLLVGGWVSGILLALLALLALVGGWFHVSVKAARRKTQFVDQLDDILQLLASNMRAGHSLQQALASLTHELAARMDSNDFRWVAQAIAIHRMVSGYLADVLDTVGETIREPGKIRRQVKALAAEGKLSAYILSGLPVVVTLFLSVTNPGYLNGFTESLMGYLLIVVAAVLMLVGVLLLRTMVRVEF